MFGKVIRFRRNFAAGCGEGEPSEELALQFNQQASDAGLRLAEGSRISHINFGRESYFGLITDNSGKGVNVHIALDPDTKVPTRASCGCFRSSTRTYCHHIVAFVRYILRTDEVTGKLRSLDQDFQDSFWNEIAWYGFKNYGDSTLGFKCRVNHGGEGLRLSFSDRNRHEILSFVPGSRLVDEFLFEFFDIVRRDIDATLFKRMYGRKLKDPNVPSERRRPWQHTQSEVDLSRRGLKSGLQQMEDSIWHRIAKVGFLVSGRSGGTFHFTFLEHKQELTVEGLDQDHGVILRFTPPRNHIGSIIEMGEKRNVIGKDLLIYPEPLKTGYRIELTEQSALSITPVVENPDVDADPSQAYLDRTELEDYLYGSYYFFPDWGFFRIAVNVGGLPAEHFSAQKRTTVASDKITAFLQEFGEQLRSEPGIFIDESLLNGKTVVTYDSVRLNHQDVGDDRVTIDVNYDFGSFRLPLREILEARQKGKRFIIRGDTWVDTASSQFTWLDAVDGSSISGDNSLTIGRTEYLRLLALHDRMEKSFSSSRVKGWFESLENLRPPSKLPSLKTMKGKLREYQKNGYGWLWFLYENGFSGLLCDDMGLGKTHQIMALMTGILHRTARRQDKIRFLVICPTTVLSHWKDKLLQYCPDLDPYVYHGTDRKFEEALDQHMLVITSYGIALRDIDMLADYHFELIVLDEVQAVKNKSTKTYAAVKALESVCMIGLTGTPIENSLTDLKSLFDVVLPGYLMSDNIFERCFRIPIEERSDREAKTRLSHMVQPFTLRRKKEQVLKELPPKIEDVRRCSLSRDQIRLYRDVVDNRGQGVVQALKDPDKNVPYMHVFAVLNNLKQICDHPCLIERDSKQYDKYSSGKWDLFVELLQESLGSGQKVVVFSQYVKMLELIESYLNDQGIVFATIKGHTRRRAEAVKRFNEDPDCMVFSASLRASGLGIDLTGGSVVIHYDSWWNSAREEQATDRVHRIGQHRGVQVFKLVTENTLEEKIDEIISRKRGLMESVVQQDDQSVLKYFTREDLIELISYR